jgi:glycosyltransferase involved in cell wall biosynthesis
MMPAASASAPQVTSFRANPIECYTSALSDRPTPSPAGPAMPPKPPITEHVDHDSLADSLAAPARVTAIVPARNEEKSIAGCLRALARQPEIAEILVVNDQSEDGTADVVRGLTSEIPELRLLETRGVPRGWVGKNNAVWMAASEARSAWLLFTDADAELGPEAMGRALEIARKTGAALVSFSPEQIMETWYEKSLIPFVYCRLAKLFSFEAVNDSRSSAAAANGQFLMIRRDAYDAIGGHQSVAGEVLEDVGLARRTKAAGYRIWFGSGKSVVRARMYRSFGAMWVGWKKNLYLLTGGTPGAVWRELLAVVPCIPFLLVVLGIKLMVALIAGLGLLMARHASYGRELTSNQFRAVYILYYVPGVLLYAGVLWASYRAHARGKVEWKGREVSLVAPGARSDRL